MFQSVGKFEQTIYQNGNLLNSLEIGAKTDGKDVDFYIKNPEDKIEGSVELSQENIDKVMQLFNQPSSSLSLLERLESINTSDDKKKGKKDDKKKGKKDDKKERKKVEKKDDKPKPLISTSNGGKKTKKKRDKISGKTKKTKSKNKSY
tara:strand:+ start:3039 stop:3482 length:444 start_codon:yes stop_codon:yes gene_type:complete